jgi:hypothetical protein
MPRFGTSEGQKKPAKWALAIFRSGVAGVAVQSHATPVKAGPTRCGTAIAAYRHGVEIPGHHASVGLGIADRRLIPPAAAAALHRRMSAFGKIVLQNSSLRCEGAIIESG